jgi:uncharacterized protein (TIGR00255 family)
MSVVSMTGFGRGEITGDGVRVVAEFSTVNRKQFDFHVNLPREWSALEALVQARVHAVIRRGHVKGTIEIRPLPDERKHVALDLSLARARVAALRQAAHTLGLADDLAASTLLAWPDVVRMEARELDSQQIRALVERAVESALEKLLAMRQREGKSLSRDLTARLHALQRQAGQIRKRAPVVIRNYRQALAARIAGATGGLALDAATVTRELALFADRCDIQEELTRLDSHFQQAHEMLAGAESCGRSLDFLCQEFFREINTIGSKANDAAIARIVVAAKADLEAIREQVQNVE